MTITTPSIDRESGRRRAFTLIETMLATTLAALILAGVLGTVAVIGRGGISAGRYSELGAEARGALEVFGRDARQASAIHWNSDQSITLAVPAADESTQLVTYAYDPAAGGCFYREAAAAGAAPDRQVLVRGVAADFAFHRYRLEPAGGADPAAASDFETRQIQLDLRAARSGAATPAVSQAVVSARFVLRNKRALR